MDLPLDIEKSILTYIPSSKYLGIFKALACSSLSTGQAGAVEAVQVPGSHNSRWYFPGRFS